MILIDPCGQSHHHDLSLRSALTRVAPCGSVPPSHAMKMVFKIKTEPVTQATIIVVIVLVSSRVTRIDHDLFPEYRCQHLLLRDTRHRRLHCAPTCPSLDDRMDPEADCNPNIGGAFPDAVPPMRGDSTFLLANKGGAVLFDLDGLSSRPLDESSTAAASRSLPLLSPLTSLGSSAYGHNLPRDIAAMLCVSPQSTGSAFRYIYLAVDERTHQDPRIAFFEDVGQVVHVLPCPDFDLFLRHNFLSIRNVLFIDNLPPHMIPAGWRILEANDYSMDAATNLSWLLATPSTPLFPGTSCMLPPVSAVPSGWPSASQPPHPYVTSCANPSHRRSRPDPKGIDSQSFRPVWYAMGGGAQLWHLLAPNHKF